MYEEDNDSSKQQVTAPVSQMTAATRGSELSQTHAHSRTQAQGNQRLSSHSEVLKKEYSGADGSTGAVSLDTVRSTRTLSRSLTRDNIPPAPQTESRPTVQVSSSSQPSAALSRDKDVQSMSMINMDNLLADVQSARKQAGNRKKTQYSKFITQPLTQQLMQHLSQDDDDEVLCYTIVY